MKRRFLLRRIQNVAAVLSIAFSIMSCSEAEDSSTVPELFQIHSQTSAYQSDGIKEGMLLRDFSRNIKCVNPQFIEGFDYVKGYEYLLYAEKVVDYIPEGYEYHAYTLKEVKLKASNWDVKTDCIVDGKLISNGVQGPCSSHIAPNDNMFCALHELSDYSNLLVFQNDFELVSQSKFTHTEDLSAIGKYRKYVSSPNPLKGERWDLTINGNPLHFDVVIAEGNDATDTVIYLFEDRTEALHGDESSLEHVLIRETLTHHSKSIYDWDGGFVDRNGQ